MIAGVFGIPLKQKSAIRCSFQKPRPNPHSGQQAPWRPNQVAGCDCHTTHNTPALLLRTDRRVNHNLLKKMIETRNVVRRKTDPLDLFHTRIRHFLFGYLNPDQPLYDTVTFHVEAITRCINEIDSEFLNSPSRYKTGRFGLDCRIRQPLLESPHEMALSEDGRRPGGIRSHTAGSVRQ